MEKIWLDPYAEGVPEELPTPEYKSLRDMIDFAVVEYADRPSYSNMGTTLTYADIGSSSR